MSAPAGAQLPPLTVAAVAFGEVVELTYYDPAGDGQNRNIMRLEVLSFPPEVDEDVQAAVEDVQEALRELVQVVHVARRNPPDRIRGGPR